MYYLCSIQNYNLPTNLFEIFLNFYISLRSANVWVCISVSTVNCSDRKSLVQILPTVQLRPILLSTWEWFARFDNPESVYLTLWESLSIETTPECKSWNTTCKWKEAGKMVKCSILFTNKYAYFENSIWSLQYS